MHYLDTSVLVAYYCPEPRSSGVQHFLSQIEDPAISPLVELEFCSAVAAKVRGGGLEVAAARRIFVQFDAHLAEPRFRLVPIQEREYRLARQWLESLSTNLRTLDALHLAAASANSLVLVTSDRALAQAAKHLGVEHWLIP